MTSKALLPVAATDTDVLEVVRRVVDLLARQRFREALALLDPDRGYANWTSSLVKRVIENYGSPEPRKDGKKFAVTRLARAPRRPAHAQEVIDRYAKATREGVVGEILFDLPLNGEWSDLTLILELVQVKKGLVLRLHDIHVM